MYQNRTALVTGGIRGIGYGIATELAKKGFTVIVGSIEQEDEKTRSAMAELQKISPDSIYMRCDIGSTSDRIALIDGIYEKFGRLDCLVNNAGVAPKVRGDLLEMREENFDFVMDINLRGTFFLTQYAAKKMAQGEGFRCVIFITSISADTSSIMRGEYCMSKAGLHMAATLFADRLASEGINVYELRPGIIETDMTAVVKDKYEAMIDGGLLPIKRMGKPKDVGLMAAALADGAFAYSTGDVIGADGGFHISRL